MKYDEKFFYEHAGYSVASGEDPEQARRENARELAEARERALDEGFDFSWQHDGTTSEEFTDEEPFYDLWACDLLDPDGEMVENLSGIDFGPDGDDGDNYARVVEAELAVQYYFDKGEL